MAGLGVVVQVRMSAIKPPSSSLKVKYLKLLQTVERQPGLGMEFTRPSQDMALLLLASGDLLPRQRARDQQVDISSSTLKAVFCMNWSCSIQIQSRCSGAGADRYAARCTSGQRGLLLSAYSKSGKQKPGASPQFVEWLLAQAVQEGLGRQKDAMWPGRITKFLARQTWSHRLLEAIAQQARLAQLQA
jgi:hypothetical protein